MSFPAITEAGLGLALVASFARDDEAPTAFMTDPTAAPLRAPFRATALAPAAAGIGRTVMLAHAAPPRASAAVAPATIPRAATVKVRSDPPVFWITSVRCAVWFVSRATLNESGVTAMSGATRPSP